MSSDFRYVGVTQLVIGQSLPQAVIPAPKSQAVRFIHQAGGTLFIAAVGVSTTQGALVPFQTWQSFNGPALFYLYAQGANATVGVAFEHTCSISQLPTQSGLA